MASNTERIIGELTADVKNLTEAIKTHAEDSKSGRAKMYQAMEEQRLDLSHVRRDVEDVKTRLDNIEPNLKILDKWRERGIGAWLLLVAIFTAVGTALAYFGKLILAKLGLT